MRAFIFACIAAITIAVIGALVLGGMQESADQAFSTSAVRLGQWQQGPLMAQSGH